MASPARYYSPRPGVPCNAPPWGTLSGIDANTGQLKWQVPLGKWGTNPGTVNLGGPLTTPTGLTFIGATFDGYFRAFSTATGQQLWEMKYRPVPGPRP